MLSLISFSLWLLAEVTYMVMQLTTWPWKTPLINLADGAMSMMPAAQLTRAYATSRGLFVKQRVFSKVHPASRRRSILPGRWTRQA